MELAGVFSATDANEASVSDSIDWISRDAALASMLSARAVAHEISRPRD